MSLVNDKAYDIRYTEYADNLYLTMFLEQKENAPFYSPANNKECQMVVKNWIGFYRFRASLTATYKNIPIGLATLFLMPYKKVSHIAMLYIIVDKDFQRKGVGNSLLKNIEHHAINHFSLDSIHLEVVKGSMIEALLLKRHYTKLFEQEAFFHVHGKDVPRVLYEKNFSESGLS